MNERTDPKELAFIDLKIAAENVSDRLESLLIGLEQVQRHSSLMAAEIDELEKRIALIKIRVVHEQHKMVLVED